MAWIRLNHILDGRIIDQSTAGKIDGIEFDVVKQKEKGSLRLCTGGSCFTSSRQLSVGIWYHVAVTYQWEGSDKAIIFYINGKYDSRHNPHGETVVTQLPMRFGRASRGGGSWRPHHAGSIFDGIIDDPSVWSRALTPEKVKEYMFLRPAGDEDGLVGWWDFNEGSGRVVHDRSVNQNHGRLSGTPNWVLSVSKPLVDPSDVEYIHPK